MHIHFDPSDPNQAIPMAPPTSTWLTIVSYREFHDQPRLILAADQDSNYWILDCSFDADRDEYPKTYSVYFAGAGAEGSHAVFDLHAKGEKGVPLGVVSNDALAFDASRRQRIFINA